MSTELIGNRLCCKSAFLGELNTSYAEATFVQNTRPQRFLKTIETLSCWYSLDSSRQVLSDEYPFTRVSIIFFMFFASFCNGQISDQQHKGKPIHLLGMNIFKKKTESGNNRSGDFGNNLLTKNVFVKYFKEI